MGSMAGLGLLVIVGTTGCVFDRSGVALAPGAADAGTGEPTDADTATANGDASDNAFKDPPETPGVSYALRDTEIAAHLAQPGDVRDLGNHSWIRLAAPADFRTTGGTATDPGDLSALLAMRWNDDTLYVAAVVSDDHQANDFDADDMWRGDSLQLAFDVNQNGGSTYDQSDDFELGWAILDDANTSHRWQAPTGFAPFEPAPFHLTRGDGVTIYEVQILAEQLGLRSFAGVGELGFALVINEADDSDRDGFLEWQSGIGEDKVPDLFGTLILYPSGPTAAL